MYIWLWWEHHKAIAVYFFFFHNVSLHHLCSSGTNTFIWIEAHRFPNPFISCQKLHAISCHYVKKLQVWIAVAVAQCLFLALFHICTPKIRNFLSLLTFLNWFRETYGGCPARRHNISSPNADTSCITKLSYLRYLMSNLSERRSWISTSII